MKSLKEEKYVAFLRGINVGGHHKVPMATLRKELEQIGFNNIVTILNSGNIIFNAKVDELRNIEKAVSACLETYFKFPIPAIVRKSETIIELFDGNPFKDIELTKDIQLYVSLLKENITSDLDLPWTSSDHSFKIIGRIDDTILSVLDLSIFKTPKAMEALEKYFGKNLTTRNWNTIERIDKKLKASS